MSIISRRLLAILICVGFFDLALCSDCRYELRLGSTNYRCQSRLGLNLERNSKGTGKALVSIEM